MIKALLFIFEPGVTWDKIVRTKRSVAFIFWLYLAPVVTLSVAGEATGLLFWGRQTDQLNGVARIPLGPVAAYAAAQFLVSFLLIYLGAKIIKPFGTTFQSQHSWTQCFTLVAYTFSPLFLMRWFDAFPAMNPWVSFSIGMTLCLSALYQGVPRVLQPHHPAIVGLYVACATSLTIIAILARFLTLLLLGYLIVR